ncbi:iron-sulfur cluster assembly scaffold protein [Candidatus Bathyarchaeota archaeon]|nr:iron-sulfur cluster assembly scaffold protein [Candidatus Bathyarchaeota archaeon]
MAYRGACGDAVMLCMKISKNNMMNDVCFEYLGFSASAICESILKQILKSKANLGAKRIRKKEFIKAREITRRITSLRKMH